MLLPKNKAPYLENEHYLEQKKQDSAEESMTISTTQAKKEPTDKPSNL